MKDAYRKGLVLILAAGLLLGLVHAVAAGTFDDDSDYPLAVPVPESDDLAQLGGEARKQDLPILLVFSAADCDYCKRLEADVLSPMLKSGETQNRVIIRKVMIDTVQNITDFQGLTTNAEQFAYQRGVQVTPTLQFTNAEGQQLVPEIVGYQSADFFGAYVDLAIEASQQRLRQMQCANNCAN